MKEIFFASIKGALFSCTMIVMALVMPFILLLFRNNANKINIRLLYYFSKISLFPKLRYINKEKIDENKNYIYIFNHQSFFDFVVLGYVFPKNCFVIGKDSLKYIPYFGLMAVWAGTFFIKRTDYDNADKVLNAVIKKIKLRKCSVILAPQGTRVQSNKVTALKRGFIQVAKSTETDIVPLILSSFKLKNVLENFRNKKIIYLKVGETISYKLTEDEILSKTRTIMNNTIQELDLMI